MTSTAMLPAAVALAMFGRAQKGALGTLRADDGYPYVSMVQFALTPNRQPVFLLSQLAVHTKNLMASPLASLLIDESDAMGDPAAGGRVTFIGQVHATRDEAARHAFLQRHPGAQMYAAFADFGVYAMSVESAHLIQGFGRIATLSRNDLFGPGS